MITIRPLFEQAQVCFILFASFALAALQNVTVDDSVSTGTVVPTYLPSPSNWNQGNTCSGCLVKPDASNTYNGTWHDATFSPNSTVSQAFEFTFVGSGLYIYFILANYVQYATTFTSVNFILDGVQVSSFSHTPSTSTNYQYNQAVYANSSIPYGQHTMKVTPVNNSVNNVLILFDYLIYTTDTTTTTLSSGTAVAITTIFGPSATTTTTSQVSPTSTSPAASSGPNVGAVIGGTLGGLIALVLATASLLCYRRYKKRTGGQSPSTEVGAVEPFVLSPQIASTTSANEGTAAPNRLMQMGSPLAEPGSRSKLNASASPPATAIALPSNPSSTATITAPSTSGALSHSAAEILEQVGLLRGEVARLQRMQSQGWITPEVGSEPPPEYS